MIVKKQFISFSIAIVAVAIYCCSCSGGKGKAPVIIKKDTLGQFVKNIIVPENFSGDVVIIYNYSSGPPLQLDTGTVFDTVMNAEVMRTTATIEIPDDGIVYTSTDYPDGMTARSYFFEVDLNHPLTMGNKYKVHPNASTSGTRNCNNDTLSNSISADVFFVSKRFYHYPDEDNMYYDEMNKKGGWADSFLDSLCKTDN